MNIKINKTGEGKTPISGTTRKYELTMYYCSVVSSLVHIYSKKKNILKTYK